MGLVGLWYRNLFGFQTKAVLPYSQRLRRFAGEPVRLELDEHEVHGAVDVYLCHRSSLSFVRGRCASRLVVAPAERGAKGGHRRDAGRAGETAELARERVHRAQQRHLEVGVGGLPHPAREQLDEVMGMSSLMPRWRWMMRISKD